MSCIYFRADKEVIYFCEKLYRQQNEIKLTWKKDHQWGNMVHLSKEVPLEHIISCLIDVFIYFRLHGMMEKIIRHHYFYTDVDEIEKICELSHWVIAEEEYQSKLFLDYSSLHTFLYDHFNRHIADHDQIYFDSLITFSKKSLIEHLLQVVGYAIDEMKREEEFQNYLQSIRDFIIRKKPKTPSLMIVQNEPFSFYRSDGRKFSTNELKTIMQREPLYLFGLDHHEMNLSPVISLLPEKIYIYGDHPSEAKTLTLINLFQERVQFFPKHLFPFQHI